MLQFVVLLAIMALWALTSLLSREAQPLPPRQARGPGPNGLRPALPASRGDAMGPSRAVSSLERSTASLERGMPGRWGEAAPEPRPAPGRGLGVDDGIMILDADARSTRSTAASPASSTTSGRRSTPARRSTRGRLPTGTNSPKAPEPGRPRALTSLVSQSMAQKRNRPLEITPLSGPLAPINSPLTQISTGAKIEHPGSPDSPPAFTSESLRVMLANTTKLREVALLTELLQPPLALRRSRRPR